MGICNSSETSSNSPPAVVRSRAAPQDSGNNASDRQSAYSRKVSDLTSNPAVPALKHKARESVMILGGGAQNETATSGKGGARLANIFMSPVQVDENYVFPKFDKSDAEREFIKGTIQDNFIFGGVGKEEMSILLDAFESTSADTGTTIIKEGDIGDYFYIIGGGKVEFTVASERVGEAGEGKAFGDLALLYDCPRAATCVAAEPCQLWRVDQTTFRQILANGRLSGDKETIEVLRKVSIFNGLTDEYLAKIASATSEKSFQKGDLIIKKGTTGHEFFILKDGTVTAKDIEAGGGKYADHQYKAGDFFGERAIVTAEPRAANIVADEDCTTLVLTREDFLQSVGTLEDLLKKATDLRTLKSIPVFTNSDLEELEFDELASRIVDKTVKAGSSLYTEGEKGDSGIYFVRSGKIDVKSASGQTKNRVVTTGGNVGITSTIFHKNPIATATAVEDAVVGFLSRTELKIVIRSLSRLNKDPKELAAQKESLKASIQIPLESLKKHRLLGVGTFGKVWLVSWEKNGTTKAYALKVQRKRQLIKHNQVDGAIREVKVMAHLDHPFILKMVNVYQDNKSVMMLLNLVQGGELYSVMKNHQNMILPERDSKFYSACIMEGLHYMHFHSILYRDLKPENVLIDSDGYAVIVDLGFAKEVKGKTFTLCGTPWYIAPEVILGRGHDKSCDYWSWGILVHEMCTGDTPFQDYGSDQMTLFKGIVKGKYRLSRRASPEVVSLCTKLFETKPSLRLGNLAGGAKDIKTHPWLADVDFSKLSKKVFRAPWKPNVKSPLDVEAFDNWDHMAKDERDAPLTSSEQKRFAELDRINIG